MPDCVKSIKNVDQSLSNDATESDIIHINICRTLMGERSYIIWQRGIAWRLPANSWMDRRKKTNYLKREIL